ncbi:MAG: hypothetical protein ACD_46C00721G0003 [uncultured bacterium]|nr:MAG: hypothetical protein ACD_46C00721G0003 [uncultured bacterium]
MRRNKIYQLIFVIIFILNMMMPSFASSPDADEDLSIDRIELVQQQITLLTSRSQQTKQQLTDLQKQHDEQISQIVIEKASKNLLDKATLEISVAKSNLESITIELTDTQQTINWLEKNIQEIDNQLNVLNIFGTKIARDEMANISELRTDLKYQQELLKLEKNRFEILETLKSDNNNILQLQKDKYNRLNAMLKSHRMLHVKQQQVKDELAYQEMQNHWLKELNILYDRIAKIDPVKSKAAYASTERDIFYANENANYAYIQSLIARYQDQIQQMKLSVSRSNSLSLLNEMSDQVQILGKQIDKLENVLLSRIKILNKHITYLLPRQKESEDIALYITRLSGMNEQYQVSNEQLIKLNKNLSEFRVTLDHALQVELSSRQGLPNFSMKMLLDLGREILLIPTLAFQILKGLSFYLIHAFESAGLLVWITFLLGESIFLFTFFFLRKIITRLLEKPSNWREQINSKWLSLQFLNRNFIGIMLIGNSVGLFYFLNIPSQSFLFFVYLSFVWLSFKAIATISRLCLVETMHDTKGKDMKLYQRLRGIILVSGMITAVTVFIHQLPMIYELKILSERLFLLCLMVVSLLLLRSWDVVPNLILSHMETRHPYFEKSIKLIGVLVPLLMVANSVIGLVGYLNLVMTVSWYEGVFLLVLIGYLILRGLLSDGMEQLSGIIIRYVNNGWLLTEAFLKPIDKIFRVTLFLSAWAVLFLLYGWDQQSPIVERLARMLHYKLVQVLNTTITPINIIELFVVISVFYWTAKWTREFVYRLLSSRTTDMGVRNSIAILSQYGVVMLGLFLCLRVLGIDLRALAVVAGMFAFGIGLGLRDLANNFACGFLILLERPLRVGDIVSINGVEGEVTHIGSRAVTVKTWDFMDLVVPNTEIFNKSFTNWTACDSTVRSVVKIKIGRHDNPHEVKNIIQNVLAVDQHILQDPAPEVYLDEMSDTLLQFEIRYFVNIRQVKSRVKVMSSVLMAIWDAFAQHGIKPPYPQQEIFLRSESPGLLLQASEAIIETTKN